MLGLAFLVLSGQFDFGGGKVNPHYVRRVYPLGIELINFDVVQAELHINVPKPNDTIRYGANPYHDKPDLGPDYFRDSVFMGVSHGKLTQAHKRRLAQLYVQANGGSSLKDPRIAKTLGLNASQRHALQIDLKRPNPSIFARLPWGAFRKSPRTADEKIQRFLDLNRTQRAAELSVLTVEWHSRNRQLMLLTEVQRKKLKSLAGEPSRSALYEANISFGLPAYRPGQPDGPLSHAYLQREASFSVLRHDVADMIGLNDAGVGRILISVEKIAVEAQDQADEYWWLLKQRDSGAQIAALREKIFRDYELKARKAILDNLSPSQLAKWQRLEGPPVAGLKTRNHFD